MQNVPPLKRAAQYVRMSTDEQQFSTANQKAAIAVWAEARGIEIIATYEDAGKSGLTLAGRPALRQLIADALAGPRKFETILVYDVSRWGRFQDADESAHLEYLCRSNGVSVHYCAEQFDNDGTPLANICKVLKRALAAEYSRELSEKVARGKSRLAGMGYHQGSDPGFGLQRRLVSRDGIDKGPLMLGERKSILTDRVLLVPGPPEDVAAVRWIFETYARAQLSMPAIAKTLNTGGLSKANRVWSARNVRAVLSCRKYVGDYCWGMTSKRLTGSSHKKPENEWVVCRDAFHPIISRELYKQVQDLRASRYQRLNDQQLIDRLTAVLQQEGKLSRKIMDKHHLSHHTYIDRFGSLGASYALCGADPIARPRNEEIYQVRATARIAIRDQLKELVVSAGHSFDWDARYSQATISGELIIRLHVAPPPTFRRSDGSSWQLAVSRCFSSKQDLTLIALLSEDLQTRRYYLFPTKEAQLRFGFRERNEEFLESFSLSSIDAIRPILNRTAPREHASNDINEVSNKFAIAPMSKALLRHKRSWQIRKDKKTAPRNTLHHCVLHLCRCRESVERTAAVTGLRIKLQRSIEGVLTHPPTLERLRSAGLQNVPSVIYEDIKPLNGKRECCEAFELAPSLRRHGLSPEVTEYLNGQHLSDGTVACLIRMNCDRQLEATKEMVSQQRFGRDFARALLALTQDDELAIRAEAPYIPGGNAMRRRLQQEAALLTPIYRDAVQTYPAEAYRLEVLNAFARQLLDQIHVDIARTRRVASLRGVLREVSTWQAARSEKRFSRGSLRRF